MSEHQTACMADETSGRSRRPLFNSASRPVRALRLTVPARLRRGIGSVCVPFDGGPVLDQTIYALRRRRLGIAEQEVRLIKKSRMLSSAGAGEG